MRLSGRPGNCAQEAGHAAARASRHESAARPRSAACSWSRPKDRAAIDAFTRSDPYHVHGVWARIDVHYYRKKR